LTLYFGRTFLLSRATVVLYTPTNEHFGIVPVEGMGSGTPVIALKSGENNQIIFNLTSIDGLIMLWVGRRTIRNCGIR